MDVYRAPPGPTVQKMFGEIADRYDLLNRLLSLSIDRWWRRKTVRLIESIEPSPTGVGLDLCTGTGDLLLEIQKRLGIEIVGADFSHPMLLRAQEKLKKSPNAIENDIDRCGCPRPPVSGSVVSLCDRRLRSA